MGRVRFVAAAAALLWCACKDDPAAGARATSSSGGARAASVPPEARPAAPGLDCDKLLGSARATSALGRAVVADASAGAGRCRYRGGAADASALVDVVVACREAAAPLARSVFERTAAGFRTADVGQKAVVVEEKGQGVVQFVERDAPCAAEVTTVPADRAVDVAREVARGLFEGGRP